ncbi:MAG: glutamate racemase [Candidatus Levybacteria bacterium RIFCSPLOWO2_01_FULL_36_13]|nr:MAG: glutamate racemase [Candidatus Levybacteria bacterium RIFCSPLOWO2_01_FULL_36_13]
MVNKPIGILDSGVGGLSIWRQIVKKLPSESTIYIADSKNCPYGSKSSEKIYQLSKKLITFLVKKKVKLIVLACNTVTVTCLPKLRKEFPKTPIIGTVPVIKTALEITKNNNIGVLSTVRTAKSKYQRKLIQTFAGGTRVLNIGTDKLVPIVESGETNMAKINKILNEELKPFLDFKIDTLALGCSHFPFLKKEMQKILGKKVLILDSSPAIARQVERVLKNNNELSVYNSFGHTLLTTGEFGKFNGLSKKILGKRFKNVLIKRISL